MELIHKLFLDEEKLNKRKKGIGFKTLLFKEESKK